MVALRLTGFSGVVPRRGARLLDQNQAQVAVNCRLTSGYIGALKQPKLRQSPGVVGVKAIFRMTDGVNDYWLAWDREVDAVKGPIAGDTTYRTYFTGDGEPKVTNLSLATSTTPYPASANVLGVYPPANAPGISAAGGVSGTNVARAFAYTFVTPWGEESQPSPASAVNTAKVDDTYTVSGMDVAPLNSIGITGGSWSLGIATVNVASTFGLRVGEEMNVIGVTPAGFNATRVPIIGLTPTTVSYPLAANPGAYVGGGNAVRRASHNTGGMTKRIYWTEAAADGTHWRLVKEVPVGTVSTTVAGTTTSTAEMASATWVMPPTDMKGIRMMPNGIAIGFHGNELCISPPYIPYAYPVGYRLTTDYDIMGVEVVGNMAVVATKGNPYLVTGIDPSSMSMSKVDQPWPCQSKRGMVNMGFGVAYPAPQGLALIGPNGSDLVTKDLYTQEEWTTLAPSSFASAQFAGRYVASFDFATAVRQMLIIDKSEFASVVTANANVAAIYGDPTTGKLYLVISDLIYEWDADPGQRMTADWFSREFVFPKPINLGAARVEADLTMTAADIAAAQAASDAAKALNAALIAALATKGSLNRYSVNGLSLNGSLVATLPPVSWESLTFMLYVDGVLTYSRTITDSDAFRLPKGYKSDNAAFRVSGTVTVKAISAAETMRGLAGV